MIKKLIKKIISKKFLLFYHKILAILAAFFYGWPSKKLIVIGVTGTAGKSTVVNLIGRILEEAGFKVGWTTTINFKIAEKEWQNKSKMTMLGRFALQKFLKKMVQAGCQYAVIETSSEGILQSRHLGIDYDLAVFTGLHSEHIEVHGSFENYKKTKSKLFEKLKIKNQKPKIINGKEIKKIIAVNLDDENAGYFLSFAADEYYGLAIHDTNLRMHTNDANKIRIIKGENVELKSNGSEFIVQSVKFKVNLLGKFNVYNALAAITVVLSQNISLEIAKTALEKMKFMPGRMEIVIEKPFKVIVDYAHTPTELENIYQLLNSKLNPPVGGQNSKLICVLGSAGGGRDKWKRPVLGEIAAKYCDYIILTNEDPYDENPSQILSEIKFGISNFPAYAKASAGRQFPPTKVGVPTEVGTISNFYEILDRREAIKKALSLAKPNDIVIITGKGCEPWICVAKGKKISWDDRKVVKEEFNNLSTIRN